MPVELLAANRPAVAGAAAAGAGAEGVAEPADAAAGDTRLASSREQVDIASEVRQWCHRTPQAARALHTDYNVNKRLPDTSSENQNLYAILIGKMMFFGSSATDRAKRILLSSWQEVRGMS